VRSVQEGAAESLQAARGRVTLVYSYELVVRDRTSTSSYDVEFSVSNSDP
jgi:hypothetical protein